MGDQAQAAGAAEAAAPGSVAGAWKWEIRKRIWDMLEEQDLALFPRCVAEGGYWQSLGTWLLPASAWACYSDALTQCSCRHDSTTRCKNTQALREACPL